MSSYLVTGGAGFIGSHLVEKLINSGHKVIVLDDFSSGTRDNLSKCKTELLEIIDGDIRDAQLLEKLSMQVTGIFHLAALVSVPRSIEDPGLAFDINTRGTQLVIDAGRKAGVRKVVMASSAAVYGNNPTIPLAEDATLRPLSPYGLDKLTGEKLGEMYASLYEMDVTALRFFNVFGPRQDPNSPYSGVISIFVDKLMRGDVPTIYGDGEQTRDFIFVEDVVLALIASMETPLKGFHVYNIARGEAVSINHIWASLCEILGSQKNARYVAARIGDIRDSTANVARSHVELNFTPTIKVKDGLIKTYDWAVTNYGVIKRTH